MTRGAAYSPGLDELVGAARADLTERHAVARLWERDATLWKAEPAHVRVIENALGWLTVAAELADDLESLNEFVDEVRADGLTDAVLLGMGGSSLAPEVLSQVFGAREGYLRLHILDSTDPAAVLAIVDRLDLERTLFIVASKSGGTTETASFHSFFYGKLQERCGDHAGQHFIAITDEGTSLQRQAVEQDFRAVFVNPSDIGGRYSALSFFGMVPAALTGLEVRRLLGRAAAMADLCGPDVAVDDNPGASLAAVIGGLAGQGRDKLTLVASPPIAFFGAWVEQLVAESTGKEGGGVLPVDLEPLGPPQAYADDRLFVYLRLDGAADAAQDEAVAALAAAGQPVVTVALASPWDLGGEFFRWEVATALIGALLGSDAFDQPNVQESKDNTRRLLDVFTRDGELPPLEGDAVAAVDPRLGGALAALLGAAQPHDYLSLQAYVLPSAPAWSALEAARAAIRARTRLATTAGYGPRFLHSTGQYHKGGPDRGLFVQLVSDDADDALIPGQLYSFSVLKRAQADGDFASLRAHGRRVLRVELGHDPVGGLQAVAAALAEGA
jgi:glucose-6-phosphate isomerase